MFQESQKSIEVQKDSILQATQDFPASTTLSPMKLIPTFAHSPEASLTSTKSSKDASTNQVQQVEISMSHKPYKLTNVDLPNSENLKLGIARMLTLTAETGTLFQASASPATICHLLQMESVKS